MVEETMRLLREKALESPRVPRRKRQANSSTTNSPAVVSGTDSPASDDTLSAARLLLANLQKEGVSLMFYVMVQN